MTTNAADAEIAAALREAVAAVSRRFRSLREVGELGEAAAAALSIVERSGPQRLRALAERARVTPASMSQTLARLVELGHLTRHPDPEDGRGALFAATASGIAAADRAYAPSIRWLVDSVGGLDPRERTVIAEATEIMRRITAE